MESSDLQQLRSFESDVRQLLKAYRKQQCELTDLRVLLSSKEEEIERLQSELRERERAYSNLKLARMIEVSDSDLRTGRLRITRLVREVNKCIRLLSAEMGDIDASEKPESPEILEKPESPEKPENPEILEKPENPEDSKRLENLEIPEKQEDSKRLENPEIPEKQESPENPEKQKDSSKLADPHSEPLTLELEVPASPKPEEPDLWADFGMLPLFSDDDPPVKK